MKNFINMFKLNIKVGKAMAVSSFLVFAVIAYGAPREAAVTKAESCAVYSQPVFNPFPVTWEANPGVGCNDFATLAGGVHGGGVWSDNFSANAGDTVTLRVYVHNGAATNSNAVMHDVRYSVNFDGSTGSSHTISAQLTASNAAEKDGSIIINTPANSHLELVSGDLNHYIGDKQPCFDFSESFFITIKVVSDTPPAPTGNKSFTATHDTFCAANNTVNGNLVWTNISDVTSVKVTVAANGNTTTIGSNNPNDNVTTNWLVPGYNYVFTEYDQNNNVIGTTSENIAAGICGGIITPPVNSSVTLTLNLSTFCVYSRNDGTNQVPTYTVNGSSDLAGQQIAWSSTKNGASTGESNANYGQVLDGSGSWTQLASRGWAVSDIGSWTKTVAVLKNGQIAATSQPFSFTVKDCSTAPATSSTVSLNLNLSTYCVYSRGDVPNQTPTYTVQGSADLAGQQIAWSSTKNGASTGESNAYYGQNLDGNAYWSGAASRFWATNDIGSWVKTVSIIKNGQVAATANFSFTVKDCSTSPTTNSTAALTANSVTFCVYSKGEQANDTIDYFITGSSDLAGQQIAWSSTKNGASTGESNANYGQMLDASAHFAHVADRPWAVSDIGSWTKTVIVLKNGQVAATSQPFAFTVKDCSKTVTVNSTVTLTLNSSTFCVYSKAEKTNDTAIYTVTGSTDLANQDVVWSSTKNGASTGESNAYYGQNLDGNSSWTGAASRTWNTSDIGSWTKTASIYANGKIAATSQPFSFTVKDCSQAIPNVICSVSPTLIVAGQSTTFTAGNGDGNYSWNVNGGSVAASSQKTFSSTFNAAGTYTATVTSAGATNTCNVQVTSAVCQVNTNFALNAGAPVKTGSTYSVQLTWTSTGSNQIKITQVNPGTAAEVLITTGSNSGNFTVTGLAAGSSYIFKMYDANCGNSLTTTSVVTPSNPGQLSCSANTSSANIGDDVTFTATGGTGGYLWATSNNSNAGTGSSFHVNFASGGNKNVTVTSGDGQTANCGVVINTPVQATGGNCNNSSNSCNNNTNNNTQTGGSGSNSSNQSNQNNINGNNNTVSNTNNNCVNNSCNTNNSYVYTNTVYITGAGTTVPANQYAQLSITKSVRSVNNGGSFQNSVSVNNGDTVQFEIVVSNNTGSTSANNVRLTDNLPSGLSLINGTVQVNGSTVSDNNLYNGMYLGTLSNGQTSRIDFQARVNTGSGSSVQNTANATSDNAGSVQASAWVFVNNGGSVLGGNVNLTYSKTAVNETKNADATSVNASREDFITYTLTVSNSGNTPANNFIITDDLSQVLPYADITDNGGGNINGNTISFPGITVPSGGSVSRSFKVRVKYALASNLSYVMTNTYGNTLNIRINNPQVLGAFVAPKTGADTNAFVFSGLLTGAAAVFKKRKGLLKLIFT